MSVDLGRERQALGRLGQGLVVRMRLELLPGRGDGAGEGERLLGLVDQGGQRGLAALVGAGHGHRGDVFGDLALQAVDQQFGAGHRGREAGEIGLVRLERDFAGQRIDIGRERRDLGGIVRDRGGRSGLGNRGLQAGDRDLGAVDLALQAREQQGLHHVLRDLDRLDLETVAGRGRQRELQAGHRSGDPVGIGRQIPDQGLEAAESGRRRHGGLVGRREAMAGCRPLDEAAPVRAGILAAHDHENLVVGAAGDREAGLGQQRGGAGRERGERGRIERQAAAGHHPAVGRVLEQIAEDRLVAGDDGGELVGRADQQVGRRGNEAALAGRHVGIDGDLGQIFLGRAVDVDAGELQKERLADIGGRRIKFEQITVEPGELAAGRMRRDSRAVEAAPQIGQSILADAGQRCRLVGHQLAVDIDQRAVRVRIGLAPGLSARLTDSTEAVSRSATAPIAEVSWPSLAGNVISPIRV